MSQVTNLAFFRARRGQSSFLCLLRQVSSVLSRNCRNEPRRDQGEASFVLANSGHGNCMSEMGTAGQRSLREAA
jgi:hypothetical protein